MTGKVWLVGAGPSDIGLLTLKGKAVLEAAEVVVYDALVSPEILALVPEGAELVNVGKRSHHHIRKQEEINRILLEEALQGKRVVRLKGGDPFLFGRGGEELQLLTEYEIPYEIVPGVTSAIAVPAYSGIPVTHRDFCSSVHIITGHKKKDAPLDLNFDALVSMKATLVFLMGVTALPDICAGLMAAVMHPETPQHKVQKSTTAEQRRVVSTVAGLPEESCRAGIEAPAIIVVGPVCRLAEDFAWAEKRELAGCRVIVTRPRDRASALTDRLRQKGAQVIDIPAIRTEAIPDNKALQDALGRLAEFQWIVFTSPAGVKVFFEALRAEKKDVRSLAGCRLAVLGPGTRRELERCGLFADLEPGTYDGASLGRALAAVLQPGERVLLPRAAKGNPEIVEEIRKAPSVILEDIPIYETLYEKSPLIDERAELEKHPQTLAVFTSASTVRGFLAATEGLDVSRVRALCIGKQTARAAGEAGMRTYTATQATMDSLEELVCRVHREMEEEKEDYGE
ncbi:MAG: uroporphyrinogen-III C-methyltransferase [Lachnospiraceae bacterium]|nr:uroporphyrinogen-III C-methyltransferase [Lachnospiraceae bacterium]